MVAEPVPIVPQDDGNFTSNETEVVVLGDCRCPGRPHDQDTAELRKEVAWETLAYVSSSSNDFIATRRLIAGLLVSWDLVDADGDRVPISEDAVAGLRQERVENLVEPAVGALRRTRAPLPNASGAPSRRSRQGSASPNPTIRPRPRHTR